MEKFKKIIADPKFWGLIVAVILYVLSGYGIVPSEAALPVANIVLGTVGATTIYGVGKNVGGAEMIGKLGRMKK